MVSGSMAGVSPPLWIPPCLRFLLTPERRKDVPLALRGEGNPIPAFPKRLGKGS